MQISPSHNSRSPWAIVQLRTAGPPGQLFNSGVPAPLGNCSTPDCRGSSYRPARHNCRRPPAARILDPRTPVRRNRRTGVRGSRISGARKSGGSGTFSKRPFPPPRPPLGNCSTPDCRAPRGTHNESFAKVSRNFAKRFLAPFKGIHTESFAKLSRKFREDRASGGTGDICARARARGVAAGRPYLAPLQILPGFRTSGRPYLAPLRILPGFRTSGRPYLAPLRILPDSVLRGTPTGAEDGGAPSRCTMGLIQAHRTACTGGRGRCEKVPEPRDFRGRAGRAEIPIRDRAAGSQSATVRPIPIRDRAADTPLATGAGHAFTDLQDTEKSEAAPGTGALKYGIPAKSEGRQVGAPRSTESRQNLKGAR